MKRHLHNMEVISIWKCPGGGDTHLFGLYGYMPAGQGMVFWPCCPKQGKILKARGLEMLFPAFSKSDM